MSIKPKNTSTKKGVRSGRAFLVVVALAIVFTAAVLRSPITSLGALSVQVQDDLALSSGAMGLLTTLPLLAFAASALFMSSIAERFGKSRVLAVGCLAIVLGITLRSYAGDVGLFGGTLLLGIGISAGNVLLPAVVRDRFPAYVGVMTALYTTVMSLFAGSAAGVSSRLMESSFAPGASLDWGTILMIMAPFAAVGAILWIVSCRLMRKRATNTAKETRTPRARFLDAHILKSPLTWWITGFFGIQSVLFYSVIAWLPAILTASGASPSAITTCVALFPIVGIPCTLFIPPLAQRMKRQRLLGAAVGFICVVGVLALFFVDSDTAAIIAVVIVGFALGAPFCLCMYYFGVRTEDPEDSAKLSGISQTFGYLMAALGPACLGLIVDLTGSWFAPLVIMFALAIALVICGWKSGSGTIPAPTRLDTEPTAHQTTE